MDIVEIADRISELINTLNDEREKVINYARKKAQADAEYEKVLAMTILKLKNADITKFENETIPEKLSANLLERIARGKCWKEKLEAEKADAEYKAQIVNIKALSAQLNGYQSLFRYLKEDVGDGGF